MPGYPLGGMRVDSVACRAGVLTRDAAGFGPLLEKSRLVDDQDAARFIPEMREHVAAQIIAHPVGIPAGGPQETLHALGIGVTDRLGELPAVLAFDFTEETEEIPPEPIAHFGTGKAASDAFREIGENGGLLLDANVRGTPARCHAPSSAWQRRIARSLAK